MKGYNYYIRTNQGEVIENQREEKDIILVLDNELETLRPPRNFWRLNLLEIKKQPETCDFDNLININCNSPNEICSENDKPFICEDGATNKPFYLDINNLECKSYCELGYMHPPRYSGSYKKLYCSHPCDTGSKQCPSDELKYIDIQPNFICSNNFFNLYYKCFDKNEALNNVDFSGIFFSAFLKTPTIYIDLKKEYTQFSIDFWYYPDMRLRYRKFTDLSTSDLSEQISHSETGEANRVIFLSDCCKVVYGSDSYRIITLYANNGVFTSSDIYTSRIQDLKWNHFVFTYFRLASSKDFTYYFTFNNDQYNYINDYNSYTSYNSNYFNDNHNIYSYWSGRNGVTLRRIIFCNKDADVEPSGILNSECKSAQWLDGFYRKLQIFDITFSAQHSMFFSHQFEDDGISSMLKHRYIYGLQSVTNNHLYDSIGNAHGRVSILYGSNEIVQNPDKTNYIIYEENYSPQGGIPNFGSKYVISASYDYTSARIKITSKSNCPQNCLVCQTSSNCLTCKQGYSLFNRQCKGEANSDSRTATYFYKNPGKEMPPRLSFNLNFNQIKNDPYFTIFFFIKIYGMTNDAVKENPVKLIIFNQKRNQDNELIDQFYLGWDSDPDKETLSFYFNDQKMFSYDYFREKQFGHWVPISFTAFRESDRRFKMNMIQASILYKNLDYKYSDPKELFPYVQFTEFTITNKWIGLLCDIKIYNKFILNAWGIIKDEYKANHDNDDIPGSSIEVINLRSDSPNSCLLSSQLLNQPAQGYKIECVPDYNPHFKGNLADISVNYHQEPFAGCCTGVGGSPNKCLGGYCGSTDLHSYENQSPIWKMFYPYYSGNKIRINSLDYIDYNRYKYVKIENIESPQDVWAVDFWFVTSTNQAVKNREDDHPLGMNSGLGFKENNNNNFNEFIIEWNYHLKVRVYKKESNEQNPKYSYIVECVPLIVLEHQDLNSPEIYNHNLNDVHYEWRYVTCGVNFAEKVFYLTTSNKLTEEKEFTSDLLLIPSKKTTLSITENSKTGYGFTIIYQLRLWNCYNCAQAFRNLDYQKSDKNFNSVLHNFDGTGTSSNYTQKIFDEANSLISTEVYQAADFPGYTLNVHPGTPKLCDESDYEYYNEDKDICEIHYNIARSSGDKQFNIPSSRNGRYSMEFWFFVENSAELSPGVNLFWELHMSITILRDTSNRNTINAICFPQSYRDNIDGKGGQDIISIYDQALNKDKYSFYQGSSKWNFVRCAVDQTRKRFYINDNLELDLEGEILYGTKRNYRPFRYFKIQEKHLLKLQNARFNPTRIFIREIKCYRDYIDFRLIDLKYKICSSDWYNCQFYPLVFCFGYRANDYYYYIFEETGDNIITWDDVYYNILRDDKDPYYTTFPDIYTPNFCSFGKKGGDKQACSGDYHLCKLNDTAYFWPEYDNYYIELDTLEMVHECKKGCRPPDGYIKRNFCLMENNQNNMFNCLSSGDYYQNYNCSEGYVQVYYECIDKNIVSKSAMYFSTLYSFPNIVFDAKPLKSDEDYGDWKTETRLASYFLEIWMKLDAIHYRGVIKETEYYLYADPHQIFKDSLDQKFKYSNKLISGGSYYYTLASIQNYEWNKIIIENSYDRKSKKFNIRFYLNYEFDNPEVSISDLESSLYKLHFRGFGFCDKKTDTYCSIDNNPVYIKWGVAWYRNFRVWDADITSLQSIQSFEYGYTELITAQKYYFPLTIDTIEKNTIKDIIDPNGNNRMRLNYWYYYKGHSYPSAFDDAMRENYSTDNFDKTYIYENNYISGINQDGTDYLISACASECKRCYSSSNTDCYECKSGYAIYGKQCKIRTGYFFKTPPNNTDIKDISIKITKDTGNFDLEKINPVTITLYIKFFGINRKGYKQDINYYIFVCLFYNKDTDKCETFIGYNYDEKTIVFKVNNVEEYSIEAKSYIGIWTHIGISIHRKEDNDYFPNMLNFMLDQQILIPKSGSNIQNIEVNLNSFIINTIPICYYSSLKIFSTFYFGSYGHVNAISSTRGSNLVYQINFFSSSSQSCLSDADILNPGVNVKIMAPVCVADYHPYEDVNNICSDDSHFMDVIYKVSPPCELCDNQCMTNCFSLEKIACTCDYNEGLYWIKTNKEFTSYECQKVDSINFAFYKPVTLYGLNVVTNDEMTIAFWLDIYEYVDNKFDSLDIIWNQHLAIKIKGNGETGNNKYLIIECHGDYDIDNPSMGQTVINNEGQNLKYNKWNYIVCQIDKFHKVMKINNLNEEIYTPVEYTNKLRTTSLIINDKTVDFNYGFSFIRELKLYSSYNFDFWDESHLNIKKKHFDYLLHHFHNDFNVKKLSEAKIVDQVENLVTKLTPKENRIGYNYVIDYEYLIICEEGYVYNIDSNRCDIFDSKQCIVPRNSDDKCLSCGSLKPYLKDDDECYDNCGTNYFADNYFKQCRLCDETCFTCFGKYYNNCSSCTGEYYYIESKHICVTNCQEYQLVVSNSKPNTCQELFSESYITVPVYLNNSYDYNPSNEDYKTKIINRDTFERIEGHLGQVSTVVKTKWIYNRTATLEINKLYRYYDINDFPEDVYPFDVADESELSINVTNDYFKYGYKYVFNLEIYSKNGLVSTSHIHKYILIMNDYPIVGGVNILPSEGYSKNTFLITINNCKDDYSEKNILQYKFTYFKKEEDILTGHNETSPEEILIQDWSIFSEVLYQFPELDPDEIEKKYYIRGYCRDEFELFYSEIQEVTIYEVYEFINKKVPLEESIKSVDLEKDLTTKQLLNRAEFLATVTVDFDKGTEYINRTNVSAYDKKGNLQEKLLLNKPKSNLREVDGYCNQRGYSYVEYNYLICDCPGYDGNMCQIDHASYDYMINIYKELFTKVKQMQTSKYNKDLIKSVNLLMRSAATFMDVNNMDFMLESIEFINLYTNRFKDQMLEGNNYEIYFDIYNSLIEYGLSLVNKLKYNNFIATNSKIGGNYYDEEKFEEATLSPGDDKIVQNYFDKIKISLQNLLEFYAANKKEIRFINRNINVYVSLIDENFKSDTYFDIEKKIYEPYMNFHRCLERTMIQSQGNPSYRVYLSSIIWKVSPYMSKEELYWNTSSPIITLKFLDYYTGEKLYLSDCGEKENQIELYFPVNNYDLGEKINDRLELLSPENQYSLNSDIFCDPVYINKSGAVFDISLEERRQKYFLGFNFSCKYYKSSTEGKEEINLLTNNLDYNQYTKNHYIKCLTNKLIQESYGEFVVDSYLIPSEFHLNSRFFYLKHYKLLSWKDNYKNNQAFYYFMISGIICIGLSLGYIYFEKAYYVKMQRLSELRKEITRLNLPYRDEYIFNNDLGINDEIRGKLKDKRKADLEEMNLDTNNIDINIMADQIAKYNKGFKRKENALDFKPEFFGIKPREKLDINTKFFNNEIPNMQKTYNYDDIPPERLDKMKKFYQVGFTGLNQEEISKKELQISKDKKNIVVTNAHILDKISEKQDEDEKPFELDLPEKDFFNDENESNKEEKSTTFKKHKNSRSKRIVEKINQYKEYSTTMDHRDTDSQLKSSKREAATKKFFNSNPPKKTNDTLSNKLVFSSKDQQKLAKNNSAFFNNDKIKLDNINISKKENKKTNIFQKEYEHTGYKPNFKKPKIINENLAFYNIDTKDFEQEKDNDNINPPYFGKRKREIKEDQKTQESKNAEMRIGFYYKNRQIDFANDEEEMPELSNNLTFEQKMEEFHGYSISFKQFLIKNILSRHIILTTFDRMSIIYDRYMRAGNFFAQLSMFAFFLSLFFVNDENQEAYNTKNKKQLGNLILYCLFSDILGCILAHLPAYCFWVNEKKFRLLYNTVRTDGGIYILKQMEDIIQKGRFFWNILGLIIQVIYIGIGFYFSFGFCATYSYQKSTFFLGLIITCLFDFFILEFVWEIIIGLLFYIRDYGRIIVFFGTFFNMLRNIKHLI